MNDIKRYLPLVILAFLSNAVFSQFTESLMTDRPGQAIGPYSVGKMVFQSQTGLDARGFNVKPDDYSGLAFAPNTLLRFGLTDHFEINTYLEYRSDNDKTGDSSYSYNGLSAANIGARFNILEGRDYIPSVGLQLTLKLPVLTKYYDQPYAAPQLILTVSEKICDKVSLLVNAGANWNGSDAVPGGLYVANLSYSISAKWGAFIENYGNFTGSSFDNYWDAGLGYLVNDNLLIDLHGGVGSNEGRIDYFTSIGVSWRVVPSPNN